MNEQLLTFLLAGERFAIRLSSAREVLRCEGFSTVPTLPPWIRGVMALRSGAIPVVDLAIKFGRPPSPLSAFSCVVVVEARHGREHTTLGLLIDEVGTLIDEPVRPTPEFGAPVRLEFLAGVASTPTGLALVLDLDRVLSIEELLLAGAASDDGTARGDADEAIHGEEAGGTR